MKQIIGIAIVMALLLFGCTGSESVEKKKLNETIVVLNQTGNEAGGNLLAQIGDTVSVDYLGTLDDGTVFDTSLKEEAEKAELPLRPSYSPLMFKVGAGQMIKGFDDAVIGMAEGDEKNVHLLPADAYGEVSAERIVEVPRASIGGTIAKGAIISASNGMQGTVVEVTESNVKVDFNHPMAGKALNFKIMMRKIVRG
jgi:peptidylprolyl isomerase